MISFEEALVIVESAAIPLDSIKIPLHTALGYTLATDVLSDIDMPPFDKAAVDGFACKRADLGNELEIVETIAAGKWPANEIQQGTCARIMTGAPLPLGADCIFMVEESLLNEAGKVKYIGDRTSNNIAYQAEDIKKGQLVIPKNTILKPQHIAILASVGLDFPLVYRKPLIGILSTGDELVEPGIMPQPSQIRNSNAVQLMAQATKSGAIVEYGGIAKDEPDDTRKRIENLLSRVDILLITGGVSMGEYDYVPTVLSDIGIEIAFKSIAVQPGRPTLFGKMGNKYVFGLPGNPVSSFVQFELLVRPLIQLLQASRYKPTIQSLPLALEVKRKKAQRKSFMPVTVQNGKVYPAEYHGSAHIHSYVDADGIISIDIGKSIIEEEEIVHVRYF